MLAVSYRPATRLTVRPQRSLRCFTIHCTQRVLHIPDNVHTLHRSPLSASTVKPVPSATTPLPPHPSASTVKPAVPSATTPLPPSAPQLPQTTTLSTRLGKSNLERSKIQSRTYLALFTDSAAPLTLPPPTVTSWTVTLSDCDVTNLAPHRCGTVLTDPDLPDVGFTFRHWNGWFGSGCGPVLLKSSERRKGLILSECRGQ